MHDCLILGSGRSGTSMVAGALSGAGYFMGDDLFASNEISPTGFYEDREVNRVNERLLEQVVRRRPRLLGRWFFRARPLRNQRWLARVPLGRSIPCPPRLGERIARLVERRPFCFKDPRFSYTLPAWRPYLGGCRFLCIFRDPAVTAASILRVKQQDPVYLKRLTISRRQALEVWTLMYRHILERHAAHGDWLFLHYEQLLSDDGLARVGDFLGATVDTSVPDRRLNRTVATEGVSEEVADLYRELCRRSGFEPAAVAPPIDASPQPLVAHSPSSR